MSLPFRRETGSGDEPRGRPFTSNLLIAVLILVAVLGVLEIIPANSYLVMPGQAIRVEPLISVKGYKPIHTRGALYMTDVSIYKTNHLLEELYGRIQRNTDVEPAQTFAGGLSYGQYLQLNDELMSDSIRKAEAAALSVTRGYKLHFSKAGPEVVFLAPNTPAASKLRVGDVVQAVNGQRVHRAEDVAPLVKRLRVGQTVRLSILRNGHDRTISMRTIASKAGVPNKNGKTPLIGVYVEDKISFPVKMTVDPGAVGGPSAGLMFTLGLVQRLEQRDITKGCKIAGTGTMDFDGSVGAIGGAKQKVVAAEQAGAQYFLVPDTPDNRGPAQGAASSINVVPVRTLRAALKFLQNLRPCK